MEKYCLLIVVFATLLITGVFASQSKGGVRFSGNAKLLLRENSVFRKILLWGGDKSFPLTIYKVIPFAVNMVLCCLAVLLYILYALFHAQPIGLAIGSFLESSFSCFLALIWYLLVGVYIGIINAI